MGWAIVLFVFALAFIVPAVIGILILDQYAQGTGGYEEDRGVLRSGVMGLSMFVGFGALLLIAAVLSFLVSIL